MGWNKGRLCDRMIDVGRNIEGKEAPEISPSGVFELIVER
jgi:hypothetical protein